MDRTDPVDVDAALPAHRDIYFGGGWHAPVSGTYETTMNPGTGGTLASVAVAGQADVDAAVATARKGFLEWRDVAPLERSRILKEIAARLRAHGDELAMIDAANCGNPYTEMRGDATIAAAQMEFFAGLVTEMKGDTIPMGPERVNMTAREPMGVVARILAFNHPFMFCGGKMAAPLAAGNSVIIKPPVQAPLSALRLAELVDGLLPDGVFNVLPGGTEAGAALAEHKDVAKVTLIGSVAAGKAVMRSASDTLKPVLLELGGKNALIGYPDSDPARVADAIVAGMNFGWCGQSCGSTSRAFLHEDIHDAVVERLAESVSRYRPGVPTDPATTMGALVSREHFSKVMGYIESGKSEGARIVAGGHAVTDGPLADGCFIAPTIFADVTPDMTIAREEIFGPVLAVRRWSDEAAMLEEVNGLDVGLTCAIWSRDLATAHRAANRVEVGFVWINEVGRHFLGAPFGGVKQSGIGREEGIGELLSFTHEKNIHINLAGQ
ncbi:NAD/NADP-dependent betaine aldehyde dehydrogenase [Roseivivax jejudonensis]|uniref:NAD/NADP-dependent betaine aldehyde dehydrogenase n=1 Tax=Roseivivax jejudonensis TaxID=1529041 RepID=A0A1X6Y3L6_9RHOB|nr:aldehyde dehydrogenase family protein [Roseivivax jejudonensis]SLN09699.1 NAD/NADP-dependent betaine aldehyde dehydrogenase [Roseivivax jejudonensis]